jgi:AcrR family transcriptional regulator
MALAGGSGSSRDGRRDRWSEHRSRRRAEFVAAALRMLETQGPELLMDALAVEAGVAKPVLYRHFSDKAALVAALGEYGGALLQDRLVPVLTSKRPALSLIREGVGAYFAVIDEHPNLYWLLARESADEGGAEAIRRIRENLAALLSALLGDYLRGFGLDSGAAEPWAYGITGLVQSTGEWWLTRRSMSRVHIVEYVTQMIWAAMSGVGHEAGIKVDPDKAIPPARPQLALHRRAHG